MCGGSVIEVGMYTRLSGSAQLLYGCTLCSLVYFGIPKPAEGRGGFEVESVEKRLDRYDYKYDHGEE